MAAYRRARELDPLWFRTTGQLAIRLAETGQRAAAEAIANKGFADNPPNLHILLGRIAWIFGDFSEAARHWSITARANSPRWSPRAQMGVADVRMTVGLDPTPPGYKPGFLTVHQRSDVQRHASDAVWRGRCAIAMRPPLTSIADDNYMAAKLMLKAGRAQELARTVQRSSWAPEPSPQCSSACGPIARSRCGCAGARAGRARGGRRTGCSARQHPRSTPFIVSARSPSPSMPTSRRSARFRAGAIRRCRCSSGLCGEVGPDTDSTDLLDIEDEPAFASLRGQPRFEHIRAGLAAHLARERAETMQLRL